MIYHGDLFDVLPTLEADSIDACVTDPPYELGFMGKQWDRSGVANAKATWEQVYRVLKPGAHLLAFGGTRTFHRLTCGIEDAGFEIRDCLSWLYGSGFPKSLDVSKAIDKAAGAEREIVAGNPNRRAAHKQSGRGFDLALGAEPLQAMNITSPATDAAKHWQGWGTALKPSWEPIILARKPLVGTVAANVQTHGTGAINIDSCRIGYKDESDLALTHQKNPGRNGELVTSGVYGSGRPQQSVNDLGRWPSNVLLDEEAAAMLDEQTGELNGQEFRQTGVRVSGDCLHGVGISGKKNAPDHYGDTGGASRFFYVAKPSREERDYGCDRLPQQTAAELTGRKPGSAGLQNPRAGIRAGSMDRDVNARVARNSHPTVKPVELMRWLVKLVTPPGGLVLDPFTGSGTTGMACRYEQRRFIGIEREADYVKIAEERIAAVAPLFGDLTA